MSQSVNNEVEVEEVYAEHFSVDEVNEAYAEFFGTDNTECSQEYLDFINSLDVAPVIFNKYEILEDFLPNPYQENWWGENILNSEENDEVDFNTDYLYHPVDKVEENLFSLRESDMYDYQSEEDFWEESNKDWNFPQSEPKYFKVTPFELIPQKRYLVF